MSTASAPRPRALGAWALACAILAPVWLAAGFTFVVLAMADTAPSAVVVSANVFAWSWFVVPLALVGAIVLGILAILQSRGKALGIAAFIVLLLAAVGVVLYVVAAFNCWTC
jgi:hypothetical protein